MQTDKQTDMQITILSAPTSSEVNIVWNIQSCTNHPHLHTTTSSDFVAMFYVNLGLLVLPWACIWVAYD